MLELNNVRKTFNIGTINEKKALCGLNLHLNPGDFVTVIGGNGSAICHSAGQVITQIPSTEYIFSQAHHTAILSQL